MGASVMYELLNVLIALSLCAIAVPIAWLVVYIDHEIVRPYLKAQRRTHN